jgi:hypothetical protein
MGFWWYALVGINGPPEAERLELLAEERVKRSRRSH